MAKAKGTHVKQEVADYDAENKRYNTRDGEPYGDVIAPGQEHLIVEKKEDE